MYSCRRIERQVQRDIHYIWLAARERHDFVTINRFRNRVKDEIDNIFTRVVPVLADKSFITPDVARSQHRIKKLNRKQLSLHPRH